MSVRSLTVRWRSRWFVIAILILVIGLVAAALAITLPPAVSRSAAVGVETESANRRGWMAQAARYKALSASYPVSYDALQRSRHADAMRYAALAASYNGQMEGRQRAQDAYAVRLTRLAEHYASIDH